MANFQSTAPINDASAVTPNDSADLGSTSRGLYVGASGDVKIDTAEGNTVTFTGLAAGIVHPIRAKRVYATDTTATNIVAVY